MKILAIDQGTTGTTALLMDEQGAIIDRAYREFKQYFPRPGWVEHDPEEIWQTVVDTVGEICERHNLSKANIGGLGITNQRETVVLWNKKSGKPVHRAIVWQCRRTESICRDLAPHRDTFRSRTGLPLDAYFSGTKIQWLLQNAEYEAIEDLICGTIDSWLIYKLTGGKVHATDPTNAARTLLYNIHSKSWDSELCDLLKVPASLLPKVKYSRDHYGEVTSIEGLKGAPILGVAGDQQAALFGQTCFKTGQSKNTYGTGCFLMENAGPNEVESKHGLLTTLAVNAEGKPCYALEGSVFIAGAAIQWLRDSLKIIDRASDSEAMARGLPDNQGVYFVPAFVGLGAPHWDMKARGAFYGLTRGSDRNHLVRAALEAMAYQTLDVVEAMEADTKHSMEQLAVDGGASANDFLMQFQADILQKPVERPSQVETTAMGAAFLAGLEAGLWKSSHELTEIRKIDKLFEPKMKSDQRDSLISGWRDAVNRTRTHKSY